MAYISSKDLDVRIGNEETENYTDASYHEPDGDVIASGNYLESYHYNRYRGYDTPDFHARLKKGELIPHTPWYYFNNQGSTQGNKAIFDYYSTGNWCQFSEWIIDDSHLAEHVPPQTSDWVQEAAAALYSTGWDGLTFMAELVDIRRLFVGVLDTFGKLLSLHGWKKLSAANEYLSVRYGWRTLLYDIKDINEMLSKTKADRQILSEKRGTTYSTSVVHEQPYLYTWYSLQVTTKDDITVAERGSVDALIDVPDVLINPMATAWEIVPLSFVVDWFFTIGKAIESTAFLLLQKQYTASAGTMVKMTRSMSTHIELHPDATGTHSQTGSSEAVLKTRRPCAVPLSPHLTAKLNTLKVLDLVGLVMQRRK